jgi:hypothetical protein
LVRTGDHAARRFFQQFARPVRVGKALAEIDRAVLGGERRHHREHGGAEFGE